MTAIKKKENGKILFRPCIDLHGGQVKQIVGSSLHSANGVVENFASLRRPASYAKYFKTCNLPGGHVVMLGQGNEAAALEVIKAWPHVFSVGGGITASGGRYFLDGGAKRIIFTSFLFSEDGMHFNKQHLKEIANSYKPSEVLIDLSCRRVGTQYYVMTKQWKVTSGVCLNMQLISSLSSYASGFLVHAVDNEGFKNGVDAKLIEMLFNASKEIGELDITYAGGVSSLQEIKKVLHYGKRRIAFTIGSGLKLYGGNLSLQEVLKACN